MRRKNERRLLAGIDVRRHSAAASLVILLTIILLPQLLYADQKPILPFIDKPMRSQLRNIHKIGVAAGNRPAVFVKVGDSITRGKHFLKDIGCDVEVLASYQSLAPTISFFRDTTFPDSYTTIWCGKANSFTRDSLTSQNGWTAVEPLTPFANPVSECPPPDDNPLRCELRLLKPGIALIMYGTNDLEENDPKKFRQNLTAVVQETMLMGVVPVLSTIPPRLDSPMFGNRVPTYNAVIEQVADTLQVPLWNYWLVLQDSRMVRQGMDKKGVHPSVYNRADGAIFTSDALRYGYNQRNLTALQVLKKIKSVVQDKNGFDANLTPNFAIYPTLLQTTISPGTTSAIKIRIARTNLEDPITLRLLDAPEGISGNFDLNSTGTSAILTLTAQSDASPGNYRITIRGKADTLRRTTTFALGVTE